MSVKRFVIGFSGLISLKPHASRLCSNLQTHPRKKHIVLLAPGMILEFIRELSLCETLCKSGEYNAQKVRTSVIIYLSICGPNRISQKLYYILYKDNIQILHYIQKVYCVKFDATYFQSFLKSYIIMFKRPSVLSCIQKILLAKDILSIQMIQIR